MSIDPISGKIIQNRVYNKINYQTSFTDFKIFHLYCKTIKDNGPIAGDKINGLLGRARKSVTSWSNDNDSHAKVTLLQYNLIEENEDNLFGLSALGETFLSLFDDNGAIIAGKTKLYETLFEMIASWHQLDEEFDIHPGLLLLRLLLQPELHFYITDQDVACVFNNVDNKKDEQYHNIVKQILEFRDAGILFKKDELKKTYTLLTGYANNWGVLVLEERSNGSIKYVHLLPEFKEIVEKKLKIRNEDTVLSDSDFVSLVSEKIEIEDKIKHYTELYGDGRIVSLHETRVAEVQQMFRNRLIQAYGQKCLLCDITNKELLIASHIKADAECNTIEEKVDNNNGFLLCANHDKLFDRFLISFNARTGKIMISSQLTDAEKRICVLDPDFCLSQEMLTPERRRYLIWHNSEFEKKENH